MVSEPRFGQLREKAPQLIIIALAIALIIYILFEIVEDVLIEGAPITSGPLIGSVVNFLKNVTATVSSWGYGGIFGLMLLEASSLPIPSEVVLPFAGYLISMPASGLNFYLTIVVATVAALIGSLIDYYIGLKGVQTLLRYRLLGRSIISESHLKVAADWFTKYGAVMVFLGRLIPGFRTLISFPAGAVKMPLTKFLAYTTAGCVLWNSILIYVGYYLGKNWKAVASISHYLIIVVIVVLIVLAIFYFLRRQSRRKKAQQAIAYVT